MKQRQPRRTETPWNNHHQTITLTRARSGEKVSIGMDLAPLPLVTPSLPLPNQLRNLSEVWMDLFPSFHLLSPCPSVPISSALPTS